MASLPLPEPGSQPCKDPQVPCSHPTSGCHQGQHPPCPLQVQSRGLSCPSAYSVTLPLWALLCVRLSPHLSRLHAGAQVAAPRPHPTRPSRVHSELGAELKGPPWRTSSQPGPPVPSLKTPPGPDSAIDQLPRGSKPHSGHRNPRGQEALRALACRPHHGPLPQDALPLLPSETPPPSPLALTFRLKHTSSPRSSPGPQDSHYVHLCVCTSVCVCVSVCAYVCVLHIGIAKVIRLRLVSFPRVCSGPLGERRQDAAHPAPGTLTLRARGCVRNQ